jgi:hypothetical protein
LLASVQVEAQRTLGEVRTLTNQPAGNLALVFYRSAYLMKEDA